MTRTSASAQASKLAAVLHDAESSASPCAPIRAELADVEAAYAVQRVNVECGVAAGRRIAGRKIGLTSTAVQRQLGVDQPDFGTLFADMAVPDGGEVPAGRLIQPKIEAEVALVLGADLPERQCTVADLLRATQFAVAALEIVDSRIADWDIGLLDTVADNASCGLYVLGTRPVPLTQLDLREVRMELARDGECVSQGTGADCLGGPLNAAVWLASALAALGDPLRAGEIVLTGALGPMAVAAPGSEYVAEISGLGSVRVGFANEGDS